MSRLVFAAILAASVAGAPAFAAPPSAGEAPILTQRIIAELSLDELFAKLPENAKLPAGERIEQEILRRFSRSGSATADLLMGWAGEAMEEKNYPLALDVLDQILVLKPDFAEAWNKRATVYFLIDDYGASLSDIRETLALEPRHFGALAGMGMILKAMDRNDEAITVLKRAIEINPRLENIQEAIVELEKQSGGEDI
jgi:tetratricopeptide (TPR) repeat protein